MKNTLHEVYLERADNPELVELARMADKYSDDWNSKTNYFYFLYYDTTQGPKFILIHRDSTPLYKSKVSLKSSIENLDHYTHESLCFLIMQFYLDEYLKGFSLNTPNPRTQGAVLPLEVQKILEHTNGYLVYTEQLAGLYQLATGCDGPIAVKWVRDFNLKLGSVLDRVADLKLNGEPITYFYDLFMPDQDGYFVLHKPVSEADALIEYLKF